MFWKKKAPTELDKVKRRTHRSADKADKDIQRLNTLLKANGITLKIYIATQEHRHA